MARSIAQKRAQKYLCDIKLAEKRVRNLEEEILLQQSRLVLNGVADGESVSKTLEGDAFEQGFTKLYDYCSDLDTELCGYIEDRDEAFRLIGKLSDDQREVIYLHYFCNMTFPEIAKKIGVSRSTAMRYHENALSNLYSKLPTQHK